MTSASELGTTPTTANRWPIVAGILIAAVIVAVFTASIFDLLDWLLLVIGSSILESSWPLSFLAAPADVIMSVLSYAAVVVFTIVAALAVRAFWFAPADHGWAHDRLQRSLKRVAASAFVVAALPAINYYLLVLLAGPSMFQQNTLVVLVQGVLSPDWLFAVIGCGVLALKHNIRIGDVPLEEDRIKAVLRWGTVSAVLMVAVFIHILWGLTYEGAMGVGRPLLFSIDGWPNVLGGEWGIGVVVQIANAAVLALLIIGWVKYAAIIRSLNGAEAYGVPGALNNTEQIAAFYSRSLQVLKYSIVAFAIVAVVGAAQAIIGNPGFWNDTYLRGYVLRAVFANTGVLMLLLCVALRFLASKNTTIAQTGHEVTPAPLS